MTSLQVEARALGDPTRHAVFRYVVDAAAPVGVAELTEHFGLNHNAIRQHLGKLVDAGLLEGSTVPTGGRGRPRLQYQVAPGAESRWGAVGPYERLAGWLAEVVRSGDSPREVGRRVGMATAHGPLGAVQLVRPPADDAAVAAQAPEAPAPDPVAVLVERMAAHGFEPTLRTDGDAFEVVLEACPFESTALAAPETVCELHLGIAEGVAAAVQGVEVDELVAKDPRRASCRLRAHVTRLDPPTRRRSAPAGEAASRGGADRPARLVGRGAER